MSDEFWNSANLLFKDIFAPVVVVVCWSSLIKYWVCTGVAMWAGSVLLFSPNIRKYLPFLITPRYPTDIFLFFPNTTTLSQVYEESSS